MRVVYIVSDIDKALAFEWIALGLKSKFDLAFVLIGKEQSAFSVFLNQHSIRFYEISNNRYPSRIGKWFALISILAKERPAIVHTHLWQANLLGLSAAWLLRVRGRIYTRHHATVHYFEHPSGRKWDLLCNLLATRIVAISKNVKDILVNWDHASERKVVLIHHGFDFKYFKSVSSQRIENLRSKYGIKEESSFPVVGVISRYMQWKGLQYVVPAFKKILEQHSSAKLILANAHGEYEDAVKASLQMLPRDSYIEIKFEEDLAALYQLFDIYVHVPIDRNVEAFGQTYVESMIAGIPSVVTLSGVAIEFIVHKQNAWVVDFKSVDQIVSGINKILSDEALREAIKKEGDKSTNMFSLENYIASLEKLYNDSK